MNHSLRYIDFPRTYAERKLRRHNANKSQRFVCECGKLGEWVKSAEKAGKAHREHRKENHVSR